MIKLFYAIIFFFTIQSCYNEKKDNYQSGVITCGTKDMNSVTSNYDGECQIFRLFDEICLNEIAENKTLSVFRIRYFLSSQDTGYIYTIYNQNKCSLLKFKKAKTIMFHTVIREYNGEGHSLNLSTDINFIAKNKYLMNTENINHLIESVKLMKPYIDEGEIKDYIEILYNGVYQRYECNKDQVDEMVSKISELK